MANSVSVLFLEPAYNKSREKLGILQASSKSNTGVIERGQCVFYSEHRVFLKYFPGLDKRWRSRVASKYVAYREQLKDRRVLGYFQRHAHSVQRAADTSSFRRIHFAQKVDCV